MEFPVYFVCVASGQYINILSSEKAVMIELYYSDVTEQCKYCYKTLEKREVQSLITENGPYVQATSGDWEFARGFFLNWVRAALEG